MAIANQPLDPKVEKMKAKITQGGADAVIILMKKYNLSLFNEPVKAAMIECFQQGAAQALEIAQEIRNQEGGEF